MTSERVYVAIDLETTGLDPNRDAIIEIGAVRFACSWPDMGGYRVLERFVTFVNPQRPIPLRIQQLTGIRDADVAGAPTLDAVAPELLAFISSDVYYVIAHNAGFDMGFLQAGGIDFHRPVQDTFELASILLPGAASYSLSELARDLDIPLPDAHRALDDAEAASCLFARLLQEAASLPAGLVRTLLDCGQDSGWPPIRLLEDLEACGALFHDSSFGTIGSEPEAGDGALPENALIPAEATTYRNVDPADLDTFIAPQGFLSQTLGPTYEARQGQADMAHRVLDAINRGDHLLIEAGTGTGKTLAYLLPSALWSMRNQQRMVVATNTIALQDQIIDKDMPLVRDLLRLAGYPAPRSALLKGRSNYLCTRRLYSWYRNRRLRPLELRLLARILVWLRHTATGDVSELFLPTPAERAIWLHIASDADSCSESRCARPTQAGQESLGSHFHDFFHQARQRAESANILVVNHALLLTDIQAGGRVLPPFNHLIVDEAHRLEEAATDQLTYRTDWNAVAVWLGILGQDGSLARLLTEACTSAEDTDSLRRLARIDSLARKTADKIQLFTGRLLHFVRNQEAIRTDSQYTQRIALDRALRSQPAWSELEIEWDTVNSSLHALLHELDHLVEALDDKQWRQKEPFSSYLAELAGVAHDLGELDAHMEQIIYSPGDSRRESVAWAELDEPSGNAAMVSAPLFVSDVIERELIHKKRSVILTGATLRTGSGFAFIRDRLGLWDVTASTVDSPFDYAASTLLFMPSDMPDPRDGQYQQAVEQAIILAALATGGSTVALFTSYAQLRVTADAIRAPLDRHGITVLQHGSASRRRLLREYRQTERAVLLGTRSFWEGVDLPGEELQCLLIVRLPFAVPSDPLVAARTADLENAFRDYTLPDAIIRFRQGFGRLIRRSTDKGIVVILDSRIWRKDYGSAFIESLPICTTRLAPLANLSDEINQWLKPGPRAVPLRASNTGWPRDA
mgnify:CR=1 FL=1